MKFNKEQQKENLNKEVEFKNPYYQELDFIIIGLKIIRGIIKDYDGDYFIIDCNGKEFYIHKDNILRELKGGLK